MKSRSGKKPRREEGCPYPRRRTPPSRRHCWRDLAQPAGRREADAIETEKTNLELSGGTYIVSTERCAAKRAPNLVISSQSRTGDESRTSRSTVVRMCWTHFSQKIWQHFSTLRKTKSESLAAKIPCTGGVQIFHANSTLGNGGPRVKGNGRRGNEQNLLVDRFCWGEDSAQLGKQLFGHFWCDRHLAIRLCHAKGTDRNKQPSPLSALPRALFCSVRR